jgi:hypothetical protein
VTPSVQDRNWRKHGGWACVQGHLARRPRRCKNLSTPGREGSFSLGWGGPVMPHRCTPGDDCPSCGHALDALLAEVDGYAVLVEETGDALQALLLSQLDAIDQVEEALELFAQRHKLLA